MYKCNHIINNNNINNNNNNNNINNKYTYKIHIKYI